MLPFFIFISLIGLTFGLPIDDSKDFFGDFHMDMNRLAPILMSPHITSDNFDNTLITSDELKSVIGQSIEGNEWPFAISNKFNDNGFGRYLFSIPKLVSQRLKEFVSEPNFVHNLSTNPNDMKLSFNKSDRLKRDLGLKIKKKIQQKLVKIGLAKGSVTKGLLAAKKASHVIARLLLKPVALITGANLKMVGKGLTIGGKLIGGNGLKVVNTGTTIKMATKKAKELKYLGLTGLGASAIGLGLDSKTI